MTEAREAAVTAAYNTVTGNDGEWNPDITLEALTTLHAAGVASGIRQAREAVQAVAEFNDISGREHYEDVLAAIDALESEK